MATALNNSPPTIPVASSPRLTGVSKIRALVVGFTLTAFGFILYFAAVVVRLICVLFPNHALLTAAHVLVWWSALPVVTGAAVALVDLYILMPKRRTRREVYWDPPANSDITVVLSAYNEEQSIGLAVRDFLSHPTVKRVIVINNNSKDRTSELAEQAGATVVLERRQGYGPTVYRALLEGSLCTDTELTLLCEGDCTFRAYDIDKFLAYMPHAEIVNGTRIVEQLREQRTQLTTFMYFGNFFAGKLLEAKHLGRGTFTDLGTTYKLCRNSALRRLLPLLESRINHEFNAHFMDVALEHGFAMLECPVSFHNRVGVSKGGNSSDWRAFVVGMRMIGGILIGWKMLAAKPPRTGATG